VRNEELNGFKVYVGSINDHAGAVGKALLKDLLKANTYTSVTAVGRREVALDDTVPKEKLVCESI
jgi:hypothetical protein